MLEQEEHEYEKVVLIGLVTKHQDEDKSKEYLDELEFLAYTAGGEVLKRFTQKKGNAQSKNFHWFRENGTGKDICYRK